MNTARPHKPIRFRMHPEMRGPSVGDVRSSIRLPFHCFVRRTDREIRLVFRRTET